MATHDAYKIRMSSEAHGELKWLAELTGRPIGTVISDIFRAALPEFRIEWLATGIATTTPVSGEGAPMCSDTKINKRALDLLSKRNSWLAEANELTKLADDRGALPGTGEGAGKTKRRTRRAAVGRSRKRRAKPARSSRQ